MVDDSTTGRGGESPRPQIAAPAPDDGRDGAGPWPALYPDRTPDRQAGGGDQTAGVDSSETPSSTSVGTGRSLTIR